MVKQKEYKILNGWKKLTATIKTIMKRYPPNWAIAVFPMELRVRLINPQRWMSAPNTNEGAKWKGKKILYSQRLGYKYSLPNRLTTKLVQSPQNNAPTKIHHGFIRSIHLKSQGLTNDNIEKGNKNHA